MKIENKLLLGGAALFGGALLSGCESDRELQFQNCTTDRTNTTQTVYLRDTRSGNNFDLRLGDAVYVWDVANASSPYHLFKKVDGQEEIVNPDQIYYFRDSLRNINVTFSSKNWEEYASADVVAACR